MHIREKLDFIDEYLKIGQLQGSHVDNEGTLLDDTVVIHSPTKVYSDQAEQTPLFIDTAANTKNQKGESGVSILQEMTGINDAYDKMKHTSFVGSEDLNIKITTNNEESQNT